MQSVNVYINPLPLNSLRDIARCFNVPRATVQTWLEQNAPIAANMCGSKPTYHAEYNTLLGWLSAQTKILPKEIAPTTKGKKQLSENIGQLTKPINDDVLTLSQVARLVNENRTQVIAWESKGMIPRSTMRNGQPVWNKAEFLTFMETLPA